MKKLKKILGLALSFVLIAPTVSFTVKPLDSVFAAETTPEISVEHNSQDIYYRSNFGAAETESTVRLGIKINANEKIKQVLLRTWSDEEGEKIIPLSIDETANLNEKFYSTEITMPKKACLFWYYFVIVTDDKTYYYGNNYDQLGGVGELYYNSNLPAFQITVYQRGTKTPDWFKHSVMYQIFPDRFYRAGNEIVEKRGALYHASWKDEPYYFKYPQSYDFAYDFYGGNLRGVEEKLDYLQDLGISMIYFNPIFESESNHHYDTGDYYKVDPILGTEADLKHLVDAAKSKGIAVILDGVFNHTGSNSIYFNRNGKYDSVGAYQSQDSPYYEWYKFQKYPYEYKTWGSYSTLPEVNETTPSYMNFIIYNDDSVLKHWMRT